MSNSNPEKQPLAFEIFKNIVRMPQVGSTNEALKDLYAQGSKSGTVLIAESQTAGRGRGDHTWASPRGGLYLSVLLAPSEPKRLTDLPILAGVAVAQAVRDCLPKGVEVALKWPNDCLLNGKKVAGVLCEAVPGDPGGVSVVGIGVNVNLTKETLQPFLTNPFSATSLVLECPGADFSVERVGQVVLRKLENIYLAYRQRGFDSVRALWEHNCPFIGKKIELSLGTERVSGIFLGLDETGALVLGTQPGERRRLTAGEVTAVRG